LIAEAQTELGRYLSDEIAPMIFAGSAEVLFNAPPEILARGIHAWVGMQLQGPRPSPAMDYLLHSARKVHHLGELELIPREDLKVFLARLFPLLISICPESDRADLAANLKVLDVETGSGGTTTAARISVSRSPAGHGSTPTDGRAAATDPAGDTGAIGAHPASRATGSHQFPSQTLERAPQAPPTPPGEQGATETGRGPAIDDPQTGAQIDRLNMLLDRWERVAAATTSAPGAGNLNATLAGAETALLSRIIDEVATSSRSTADLNNQLRYLNEVGVGGAGSGVFRVLSSALPDWAPAYAPATDGEGAPPLSGAAETMKKVVDLAKDPAELNERFRELITTAVDEFNNGSLGRAVTVVDLAQRMISQKEVDVSLSTNIIDQTTEKIDENQLRKYAENEDKRLLLRRVLTFFPAYQIDNLMQDLMVEERRDRRRILLRLLMIHGNEARQKSIDILEQSLSGNVPQPWFVQRNLIYLMRSINAGEESDLDKEIDLLVRASVPGGELPLLREALTALGQIDHPRAGKTLVARVSDLEDVLLQKGNAAHQASEIQSLLDTAIKAMIRFDSKEARQCVVTHGLKRRPEFGNSLSRLAMLGNQDLSNDPATISRIIEAIKAELPVKVFGVSVKTSKKAQNLECLFESLSGTDIPKVRKVYDSIVRKFPGERFANSAAKCLTKLGSKANIEESSEGGDTITSLSGDLALFGLPNLMQNLADSRVEGVLTVLDDAGNATASITLRDGMMIDAKASDLQGETAVYQLLERPILGRFIFVNQPVETAPDGSPATGMAVMSLLMEGMRRYDEFNRAAAVIPEEAQFVATGKQPTGLPDEDDADFVNGIWVQATQGRTARAVENDAQVDGYRVFRLFEHWVHEGALEQKAEDR
jgi:hypothetical protein